MAAKSGPSQPSGSARTENAGDLLEGLGIGSGVPVSHRLSGVSSGWPLRFDADVVSVPDETQGHRGFDYEPADRELRPKLPGLAGSSHLTQFPSSRRLLRWAPW